MENYLRKGTKKDVKELCDVLLIPEVKKWHSWKDCSQIEQIIERPYAWIIDSNREILSYVEFFRSNPNHVAVKLVRDMITLRYLRSPRRSWFLFVERSTKLKTTADSHPGFSRLILDQTPFLLGDGLSDGRVHPRP